MTTSTAVQPALLFIPDISGFTKFVSNTEVNHARHIINELLETIIDSDDLGLEISEMEGDAIFFYRYGKAPTALEMLKNIEKMFVNFQAELKRYDKFRICDCGACSNAHNLTLKFFTHYGQVSEHVIRNHRNLFGEDVILIHRLMKNNIDSDEYFLFTSSVEESSHTWAEADQHVWTPFEKSSEDYDLGTVDYSYLSLTPLMDKVPEPVVEPFKLKGKVMELLEQKVNIKAPIDLVFNVVSDLGFRPQWQKSLKAVDDLNNTIPQNGSTHRCIVNGGKNDPFFVSHDFERKGKTITFFETDRKQGFMSAFTLTATSPESTHLKVEFKMKQNVFKKMLFNLILKRKIMRDGVASMEALKAYCEGLVQKKEEHAESIVLVDLK